MSQWDKLFQQKLKEVMHSQHRDYVYASLSPAANGNVARALIAEEYYAQADRIAELEKALQDGINTFGEIQDQQLKNKFETPQTKPLSGGEILEIASNVVCSQSLTDDWRIHFARAIEAKVRGEK